MKLEEIRKRAIAGDLNPPPPEPSLEMDLCLCGVEPSIASFEIGKKLPSLPGGPRSYVFARAQVRPGDTDVPLCGKCVKILEGMGFTTNPF